MNIPTQPNTDIQPTDPLPQTVSGILTAHANEFADPLASYGDEPNLATTLSRYHLVDYKEVGITADPYPSSTTLPFTSFPTRNSWQYVLSLHQFITCDLDLKFEIIKPRMVTGKYLFKYCSDPTETLTSSDRKSFKVEWDVSQSNTLEIPITSMQFGKYRICTGSHGYDADTSGAADLIMFTGYKPRVEFYKFGTFTLDNVSTLQSGSIYPDSFTLLTFLRFRNPILSIPRQYLSTNNDCLVTSRPT